MHKFLPILLAAGALITSANAASAQSETEFVAAFSGEWRIHEETFAQGVQICRLTLSDQPTGGRYGLKRDTCSGELAEVSSWGISDGQLALFAGEAVAARLGGTQRRLTGTTAGNKPLILDRADAAPDAVQAARATSPCYYLGFGDRCASDADLAKPATGSEPARIHTLVNLNVRAEARDDASVVGVVPVNNCVTTDACLTASDGVWCRAEFGERTGWLRKFAVRQNRWPVVTFANQCEQ